MRIQTSIIEKFDSAHYLRGYDGNCAKLHGHTWKVQVFFEGKLLDELGMLLDFRKAKKVLRDIVSSYDHDLLNNIPPFNHRNPTAENIALDVFRQIESDIPETIKVRVYESESSYAEISRS